MKALKILFGIFVTIFILVIGTGVALNYFLDLNKYIPQIEAKLEASTGLEWTIKGPVKLALFPGANLAVSGIRAEDKGGSKIAQLKAQSFAFDKAGAKIAWFPQIMSKEIIVKEFFLDKLDYSKKVADGGSQKMHLKQLALKDIYVGFADMAGAGLVVRPNNADKGIGLNLAAQVEQLDKTGARANLVDIDFKALLEIAGAADAPFQKLTLSNTQIDVNAKMPNFKEGGLDVKIKTDMALDLSVKTLDLSNVKIAAAGEELTGQAKVNFAQKEPKITFEFNGQNMSLDGLLALMAPKGEAKAAQKTPKPLPKFTLDGHVAIAQLKLGGVLASAVDVKVKGQGGTYNIAPVKAKIYGGNVSANISVQGASVPAKCAVNFDVNDVMLGALLKAAANQDMLDGTLQTAGDIALPCLAGPVDIAKAKGAVDSSVSNGVIQKWNVSKVLNQAQSVAKALSDGEIKDLASVQAALNVNQGDERFEFTKMIANVTLDGGIAQNTVFDMKAPLSEVGGDGQFDLVKGTMDYNLRLNLSKTKDNNKYFVPIKLSGPFTKPSYKIDTQKLLASQLGDKLKESLNKELDGKLGDKLDGALGGELLKALPF